MKYKYWLGTVIFVCITVFLFCTCLLLSKIDRGPVPNSNKKMFRPQYGSPYTQKIDRNNWSLSIDSVVQSQNGINLSLGDAYVWVVLSPNGININSVDSPLLPTNSNQLLKFGSFVQGYLTVGIQLDVHLVYPVFGRLQFDDSNGLQRSLGNVIGLVKKLGGFKSANINKPRGFSCSNNSTFMVDVDFKGGDMPAEDGLENPAPVSSMADCCRLCSETEHCQSFTFTSKEHQCWLKTSGYKLGHQSGCFSGQVTQSVNQVISRSFASLDHDSNSCCTLKPSRTELEYFSEWYGHMLLHVMDSQFIRIALNEEATWTQQFPVGTGLVGALVGGTIEVDVVPVSIAGLFIKGIEEEASKQYDFGKVFNSNFQRSQMLLMNGEVLNAEKALLTDLQYPKFGMFQYVADIILSFNLQTLQLGSDTVQRSNFRSMQFPSRQRLVDFVTKSILKKSLNGGEVFLAENLLDMKRKIAGQSFSQRICDSANGNCTVYFQQRAWRAVEEHDVIIGEFNCIAAFEEAVNSDSVNNSNSSKWRDFRKETTCLNMAMTLFRVSSPPLPQVSYSVSSLSHSEEEELKSHFNSLSYEFNIRTIKFEVGLKSIDGVSILPEEQMCGMFFCVFGVNNDDSVLTIDEQTQTVICNGVHSAKVFVSIASQTQYPLESTEDLQARCSHNVIAAVKQALNLGIIVDNDYDALSIGPDSHDYSSLPSCPHEYMDSQIQKLENQCPEDIHSVNTFPFSAAYNFGRYLLVSSGTKAVMNLQGIWADGPTSAWSGDYHMNINLQMNYWAAGSVGLSMPSSSHVAKMTKADVMRPLVYQFIAKIADKYHGQRTAQRMYGVNTDIGAWAAHGFTDGSLNTDLLGDAQWGLCVSCGHWLAIMAWEYFLYTKDYQALRDIIVPILRGAAAFYDGYLWRDKNGFYNTGPTTSPENSYAIGIQRGRNDVGNRRQSNGTMAIAFITVSPAIDMSVIRQVHNAYELAIQWIAQYDNDVGDRHDKELAERLAMKVAKLPGMGFPIIRNGYIMEYYNDFWRSMNVTIGEDVDCGHRHFSAMHWLYPGYFQPGTDNSTFNYLPQELFTAAKAFMSRKVSCLGGHTSWSAAWEASLFARLGDAESSFKAIRKLIGKYTAGNLMSLHPSLMGVRVDRNIYSNDCSTCFREAPISRTRATASKSQAGLYRGLVTREDDKFQIDGNLGYVAAINEMLVHSHARGHLVLLPALPAAFNSRGTIRLKLRGDCDLSLAWKMGKVSKAAISINSLHPWLMINGTNEVRIAISSPNKIILETMNPSSCCSVHPINSIDLTVWDFGDYHLELHVVGFPCGCRLISSSN